ncbi:DNA oxidative demethylase AlkB [Ottowia sp.]|uniref:DNA oxidative demethylase AlkB n=1 Tax=Ottowia sp. TaxID=1898956 RepID=UPI002BE9C3AA|nr:DNA oxidative demethylase AlkB [Ottowia sp.]HOB65220.1 DNA oxidative demethylase AlkB [Ottowia sp.]HPZ56218.1 DNA oxidative demethylase AlkB [Ottowia sp.]HQD48291.1 DNA oxidative demethylase AlkB [Ottowia sp.]
MTGDLFADRALCGTTLPLGAHARVLRGFALAHVDALWPGLQAVIAKAPLRHMVTPGGQRMSVALTNCGALGWVSDRRGYRYAPLDPDSGRPWPALPVPWLELARGAAEAAGFADFTPDACLINRYAPGARMGLHQDRDERHLSHPIVSVSLGVPAVFLWGGLRRIDRTERVTLLHGDVAVWGGVDRLRFHGIAPLRQAHHPLTGAQRINVTLRRAG